MWNTGCNVVYNRTTKRLLYGENTSRTLLVPRTTNPASAEPYSRGPTETTR